MRELGTTYEQGRARVVDLVSDLGEDAAATPVPATPGWSVHDLIAHLAGNCTDAVTGNVDGLATPPWTAAQVDARRTWPFEKILDEWDDAGPQMAALLDDFPGRYGDMAVSDLTVHEHDLRGALDRPGARDSDGVAIGIDFLVMVFLHSAATALGLEPLEVRANGRSWTVGTGGPATGDADAWHGALLPEEGSVTEPVKPIGTLDVLPFELLRAIAGRRTAPQIRSFDWSVDPSPYVPTFGFGPFKIRSTDLGE